MLAVGLFMVALINSGYLSLEAFRFRSLSTYYENGKLGNKETNYWELANTLYLYSGILIWSIAAVVMLLELFIGSFNSYLVW